MKVKTSNHRKCFLRDNKIVEAVTNAGFLNTDQITLMLFSDIKNGKRAAQKRLKHLTDHKYLYRKRVSFDEPYVYYTDKKNATQANHMVAVNWAIMRIQKYMHGYEKITKVRYEQDYGILRCDAFVEIYNDKKMTYTHYFIEADISHNKFDKIAKYNELYSTGAYLNREWVKRATGFPSIIIVSYRKSFIDTLFIRENKHELNFVVMDYDKLRGELTTWPK